MICVDDYGNEIHLGHYSEKLFKASDGAWFGAIIPGCTSRYLDHRESGKEARRDCYRLFCDMERNCNTCRYLVRVKHDKTIDGFLRGRCENPCRRWDAHPYVNRFPAYDGAMIFHPDDYMGMMCYESRWTE